MKVGKFRNTLHRNRRLIKSWRNVASVSSISFRVVDLRSRWPEESQESQSNRLGVEEEGRSSLDDSLKENQGEWRRQKWEYNGSGDEKKISSEEQKERKKQEGQNALTLIAREDVQRSDRHREEDFLSWGGNKFNVFSEKQMKTKHGYQFLVILLVFPLFFSMKSLISSWTSEWLRGSRDYYASCK